MAVKDVGSIFQMMHVGSFPDFGKQIWKDSEFFCTHCIRGNKFPLGGMFQFMNTTMGYDLIQGAKLCQLYRTYIRDGESRV